MNQIAAFIEYAFQHTLGAAHFPQNIDMQPSTIAAGFVGNPGLGNAALDGIFDQLLMAVLARAAAINLRDRLAQGVKGVRIDP